VIGVGEHVRRRVRQRHAALRAHQARGRLRPPPYLPRSDPDPARSFVERKRMFDLRLVVGRLRQVADSARAAASSPARSSRSPSHRSVRQHWACPTR
jgi:hypothetical protein